MTHPGAPRKPRCTPCGVAESVVICGVHKKCFCLPCSSEHQTERCYFNAAPAVHLLQAHHVQLALKFEEAQP